MAPGELWWSINSFVELNSFMGDSFIWFGCIDLSLGILFFSKRSWVFRRRDFFWNCCISFFRSHQSPRCWLAVWVSSLLLISTLGSAWGRASTGKYTWPVVREKALFFCFTTFFCCCCGYVFIYWAFICLVSQFISVNHKYSVMNKYVIKTPTPKRMCAPDTSENQTAEKN